MKEKLYAARFFMNYSDEVTDADVVHIPHISDQFVATDVPVTNGNIDGTDISETKSDLTVDTWKAAAYILSKFENRETMKSARWKDEYRKAMGYRLGRALEISLLGLTTEIKYVQPRAGLTTTDLVATNIEHAMGILASNSIPKNECQFFFDPNIYWGKVMSVQKYYDASQFGNWDPVHVGYHDKLYGVPVVITPNVQQESGSIGIGNSIMHPTAIAYAAKPVDFTVGASESLRTKLIADIIYGAITVQKNHGVRILSTS